eukprot:843642-Pelagomonas_calceolata.AAC.1
MRGFMEAVETLPTLIQENGISSAENMYPLHQQERKSMGFRRVTSSTPSRQELEEAFPRERLVLASL